MSEDKKDMTTSMRRQLIREIIGDGGFAGSQEELKVHLKDRAEALGYDGYTSQASISRDFKEIGVVWNKEKAVWELDPVREARDNLNVMVQAYVQGPVEDNVSTLVLKTAPGFARATAVHIEYTFQEEVVGTLSGEDLIMVLVRSEDKGKVCAELNGLLRT